MVGVHCYGSVDGLQKRFFIDARKDEPCVVEALGALCRGADANSREGVADRGEEARFFGKRARVGNHGGGVHLKAVVVVEAERFMTDDAIVELEAGLLEAFAASRVATVENGHVIFLGNCINRVEQREEIFLGVDVFLAVGREQDVFAFFKSEALVYVARLDFLEVLMQNFCHWASGDVGALFGEAAVGEVAAGVLAVAEVYIGYDVDYASVCLFGEALVLAAVSCFHVEDWNVEAFGRYCREA